MGCQLWEDFLEARCSVGCCSEQHDDHDRDAKPGLVDAHGVAMGWNG